MTLEKLPGYLADYSDDLGLGGVTFYRKGPNMVAMALTPGRESEGHLSHHTLGKPISSKEVPGGMIEYEVQRPGGNILVTAESSASFPMPVTTVRRIRKA
jgi:hypothetical protein